MNDSKKTELPKTYDAATVEPQTYETWLKTQAFRATPDDRPADQRYVVMMPLPNVTGALHMGHAMDNVMQDLLIRWHRMQGDNTLWQPGTDHAGIATQAVVEKRLMELEGKTRHDLGRDGLVARIWQWKDQYQARIIAQQQRMGCSCDWDRQRFTMDAVCARAVRHAFFRLFKDALIYRGKRLVNWDVHLQTSVSDDEVYHETVSGHFWHLRYPVIEPQPGEPEFIVVATTRPETMLGDTAVAVHPDPAGTLAEAIRKVEEARDAASDKERPACEQKLAELTARRDEMLAGLEQLRDMALAGRMVRLPLLDRAMPLICDTWAKPELGSGCVKITPAHDPNDYAVWMRHKDRIGVINILNPDGTLNDAAGPYAKLDRYAARDKVIADLQSADLLDCVEDREVEIGHSDRSKTPIEPLLSDQWFIRMGDVPDGIEMGVGTEKSFRSPGLVQAAIDAVTSQRTNIHPERYTKTYLDWLAEKRDWPISRQLWWGHQIPVWSKRMSFSELQLSELAPLFAQPKKAAVTLHLLDDDTRIPLSNATLALDSEPASNAACAVDVCLLDDDAELTALLGQLGYVRDPDVLDTWFSSALWPLSTLGWPDPQTAAIGEGQVPLDAQGSTPDALSYYYPGSCLVTGRDIITLWVARMVIAGLYLRGDVPFSDVFIHANILDGKGERMSKSKGNGIDPVDIIERYGTDAMRYVLCDMQTGTQDIRLPVTAVCPRCEHHNDLAKVATGKSIFIRICCKCGGEFDVLGTIEDLPAAKLISERFESGRAFCTKLWNSMRFALGALQGGAIAEAPVTLAQLELEDRWILDGLNLAIRTVQQGLAAYNPSAAINAARDFFWGSLCDWYLELIKPRLAQGDNDTAQIARRVLGFCMDQVLRLFHPFIPFISEHLWQQLNAIVNDRSLNDEVQAHPRECLIAAAWPQATPALEDAALRESFQDLQLLTRAVRDIRLNAGVSPRQTVDATIRLPSERQLRLGPHMHIVRHMAKVHSLTMDDQAQRKPGSAVKAIGDMQLFVHNVIDDAKERTRLEAQREKLAKEVQTCSKKLGNAGFIARAPAEVVQEQRDRLAQAEASMQAIDDALSALQ